MSRAYRAVLFDLFGTLVRFDATALPEIEVDGRRVRSTLPRWSALVTEALPALSLARFADAVVEVSAELDGERAATAIEIPSRERFRRALLRVACPDDVAAELAPLCARGHMQAIADATRFPAEHAQVLATIAARGPIAVITNFDDTATAYTILATHGILARASSVVVSEAIGLRKPHPALVRTALRDLAVAPADAVMIGDHAREDVGAAAAAGVDAIWIDVHGTGLASGAPVPQYVVRTLREAAALVA